MKYCKEVANSFVEKLNNLCKHVFWKGVLLQMTIQERLKSLRMQVSSGIDAFCEELLKNGFKITAPTIYGYEGGQRQPSVSYISGLSRYKCKRIYKWWYLCNKNRKCSICKTPAIYAGEIIS